MQIPASFDFLNQKRQVFLRVKKVCLPLEKGKVDAPICDAQQLPYLLPASTNAGQLNIPLHLTAY
jgi:hypothetical protein